MTSALRPVSDLFQAGASHYKQKLGHYQKPINPAYGGIGAPWFAPRWSISTPQGDLPIPAYVMAGYSRLYEYASLFEPTGFLNYLELCEQYPVCMLQYLPPNHIS